MSKNESPEIRTPGFYYGYIIVFVSLIIMMLTFGVNYSFGIFFEPLSSEFGWNKAITSAAYSIATLASGFIGIFAGRLTDRFGAKYVCMAGGCFLGLGCILLSQLQAVWQFYLIHGLILSAGVGGVWPSLTATVPKWFVSHRGITAGIVASGIGFSQIIIPPWVSRLIPEYGWRMSYIILGIVSMVFIIAASLLMKRDPHSTGQPIYGEEREKPKQQTSNSIEVLSLQAMIRNRNFWLVCLIYFCFGFGLHTIMVHIVPHAIDSGITPEAAATIIAVIGGMSIASKLLVGGASSKLGVNSSLAFCLIIFILGFVWLLFSRNLQTLYLFAAVFGFAYGGIMAMQSLLSAQLFGLSSLGLILGSVSFVYTIGSALGPFLSGYIFDVTASYTVAFLTCALLAVSALILQMVIIGKSKAGRVKTK